MKYKNILLEEILESNQNEKDSSAVVEKKFQDLTGHNMKHRALIKLIYLRELILHKKAEVSAKIKLMKVLSFQQLKRDKDKHILQNIRI